MKYICITPFFLLAFLHSVFAQQFKLSGTVKDTHGEPISFATVYVKNTTMGTSANIDGAYAFKLNKGTFTVIYKAIGYKPLTLNVELDQNTVENIILVPETYLLKGVTISANAEDPAYEIIRQAIKNREKHLNEVNEFSCRVYIKGMQKLVGAPKKFFGRDVQKRLDLDTNRKGILYLS